MLPTQRTNENTLDHFMGGRGCHVARFAAQFVDEMKNRNNYSNKQIKAQITFDELKIKCRIVYNSQSSIPTSVAATDCLMELYDLF